jgi:tRNA-2-methylthio-N6-dimethylallyladenosine synthase
LKKRGTLKYLGVCGCMGQKEGKRLTDAASHLDLVMGPGAIGNVVSLVDRIMQGERPVIDITGIDDEYNEIPPLETDEVAYPRFVSIMMGCDNRCTYCIVPYTRGGERSRDPQIIIKEIESLAKKGYREITLIGQTVNSYQYQGVDFAQLLEMVNDIPGLQRIRFATSHPGSVTREMLDAISRLDHVCEQLHLPIQSGSNRILKRMARNYTKEEYIDNINYFRNLFKDSQTPISLTTDIIVGFPGETDEEFEETMELMRQIGFDAAYMFKFSARRGTPAATMPDQVSEMTKSLRLDRLIKQQQGIARELNDRLLGQNVEVMVERVCDTQKRGEFYEARMRTGRVVKFNKSTDLYKSGDILDVNIEDCTAYALFGKPVKKGGEVHAA